MIANVTRIAVLSRKAVSVMAFGLMLACAASAQDAGRPKLLPDAKATACAACHAPKSPLPPGHAAIEGKSLGDCRGCHARGSSADLRGKMPLSHAHFLAGLTCATCHADPKKPEPVAADRCMGCHDPEKVFAATAGVKPENPHGSPHYGKDADCNLCHHQHERSENFCSQCHKFNFKVP